MAVKTPTTNSASAFVLELAPAPSPAAPAAPAAPESEQPALPARRTTPALKPVSPAPGDGSARFPGIARVTSTELWVGMHLVGETQVGEALEKLALCAQ